MSAATSALAGRLPSGTRGAVVLGAARAGCWLMVERRSQPVAGAGTRATTRPIQLDGRILGRERLLDDDDPVQRDSHRQAPDALLAHDRPQCPGFGEAKVQVSAIPRQRPRSGRHLIRASALVILGDRHKFIRARLIQRLVDKNGVRRSTTHRRTIVSAATCAQQSASENERPHPRVVAQARANARIALSLVPKRNVEPRSARQPPHLPRESDRGWLLRSGTGWAYACRRTRSENRPLALTGSRPVMLRCACCAVAVPSVRRTS